MPGKSKTKMKNSKKKVTFEFLASEANEVYLAGDSNNWNTRAHPMKKDKDGRWEITLPLEPGKYEYRFFIDGRWENDPACSCCMPNEFGGQNCAKVVE